jgi:hypothetical protein
MRISGAYNGKIYGGKHGCTWQYLYCSTVGTPADGGYPGGRRTGGHPGGHYSTNGHTCLRYRGKEDTEGAPAPNLDSGKGKMYQHRTAGLLLLLARAVQTRTKICPNGGNSSTVVANSFT